MSKKRKAERISSGLVGFFTGALIGYVLGKVLQNVFNMDSMVLVVVLIILLAMGGLYFDMKEPMLTERLSFWITLVLFFGMLTELVVEKIPESRNTILIIVASSLVIFIINTITGRLKHGSAKKALRKQVGM